MSLPFVNIEYWHVIAWENIDSFYYLIFIISKQISEQRNSRPVMCARVKGRYLANTPLRQTMYTNVRQERKDATKTFDNTPITDRLMTVSWSDSSHQTTVVNIMIRFHCRECRE